MNIDKLIPQDLPLEQQRQWIIKEIAGIDESRRDIKSKIKFRNQRRLPVKSLNNASDRLFEKRKAFRDRLGQINQEIKERNLKMHSLPPGEVQIFIEMAKLLEEKDPDYFDNLRNEAEINLNIRNKRTKSGYVKFMNA